MIKGCPIWNSETQKRVHHETLNVLKNVGLRVDNDEAIEIFHASGAHIIKEKIGGIVRLPENVVGDCIG